MLDHSTTKSSYQYIPNERAARRHTIFASSDMVLDGGDYLINDVREHGRKLSRELLFDHIHVVLVHDDGGLEDIL